LSRPTCSVVIPTYNGRALLETCLASVERHWPAGVAIEVIVVDDGSTDGTAEWLDTAYPAVRLVRLERNGGFCAAANAGIAAARGRIIQLLNNDTEVQAGWIEAGIALFEDPRVGSVAPLVLSRSDPSRVDSAGDRYLWFGWPMKRGRGQAAARWIRHRSDTVFGASGSTAFYRAEPLQRLGGFDPAYGAYYEDVDLAFRLRRAGFTCRYAPACRVLHEVSASYDHRLPQIQRMMARNAERLFWSNVPPGWLIAGALPHVAFVVIQGIWRVCRGRGLPFLLGKLDALHDCTGVQQARIARTRLRRGVAAVSLQRGHRSGGLSNRRAEGVRESNR
jgi:GT2 family glycosyltransferase